MSSFIAYRDIGEKDTVIVDGQHKSCVKLSHWTGANIYPDLADDSSAGIVLNAIEKKHVAADKEFISATHFDIDGLAGVWSLMHPDKAIENKEILKQMALTGDFREYDADAPGALTVLKLVCWMNHEEKTRFYPPFGVENELSSCYPKFKYFISCFEDALNNINVYDNIWLAEYNRVLSDIDKVRGHETKIEKYGDIGLIVVETPEPLHYYALTGETEGFDTVLCIYSNNRYELEYKYTTWIDMVSRPTYPRLLLNDLIRELNQEENGKFKWYMDRLADAGPILRLIDTPLPKVVRYDQPYLREIFPSSLNKDVFKERVIAFFRNNYSGITPKPSWAPAEIRKINQSLH